MTGRLVVLVGLLLAFAEPASAAPQGGQGVDFSGTWKIDLRTADQRRRKVECGSAQFKLVQDGDRIDGDHSMSTPDCGRVNEGGERSVVGAVHAGMAFLVVTSGRNGAIVFGKAMRRGNTLVWQSIEEIKAGDPEGDSPLILSKGVLHRQAH